MRMAQSETPRTDEPLPTDDEGNPDYATALAKMGLGVGETYRVDGRIYRFHGLKNAHEPYAAITSLTDHSRDPRTEARVDEIWYAYREGDLDVGGVEVTFMPENNEPETGGD